MTGRRAIIVLLALSALVFCAFAAPNAMALKGTTAFTCKPVKKPGPEAKGFTDEHCTKEAGGELVSFIHEEITPALPTGLTVTNNETTTTNVTAKFKSELGGMEFELEAPTFKSCIGTWLANQGVAMFVGGKYCGEFTGVKVTKPAKCSVEKNTVELEKTGFWITEVKVNKEGKEEMWAEFRPPIPEPEENVFTEFKFEGAECALKGKTVEVTGTARGNPTTKATPLDGATLKFTTGDTGKTLKVGAAKAEFSGTFTPRMSEEAAGEELNPITLTTTEK